jgi:hypothetical protein
MGPASLQESLAAAVAFLPREFRAAHARLFEPEHLGQLAARLLTFWRQGVPESFPPPHFAAECTPPLGAAFAFFRDALAAWDRAGDKRSPEVVRQLADAVASAGCANLLLLLGQRRTPASLTDARATPPTRAQLLAAATRAHHEGDPLTVAGRALAKHVPRSADPFWGAATGPTAAKNEAALRALQQILDGATWWNVFGHFAHGSVYEARLPDGYGARWGRDGAEFIGFLEPFDEEKCPSLEAPAPVPAPENGL